MTISDKVSVIVLAIAGGYNGFVGLGTWLLNKDSKLTDLDVAGNLLACAGALTAIKGMLNENN